jgi:hypothetical protein
VKTTIFFACLLATPAIVACGDSSGSGGAGGASSTSSSHATTSAATTGSGGMCIQPGEPGNDLGVGHYCTPGGMECKAFPLAPLCLADVGQDEWFCTRIGCDATTNCGMNAGCLLDPAGSACVLCKCDDAGIGCMGTTSSSTSSSGSSTSTGG